MNSIGLWLVVNALGGSVVDHFRVPVSPFQSESKCEIFVMVISSNFNMNEN